MTVRRHTWVVHNASLHGESDGKSWIEESLRTPDPAVAKQRHTDASAKYAAYWNELRRSPSGMDAREATAIAGEVYKEFLERHRDGARTMWTAHHWSWRAADLAVATGEEDKPSSWDGAKTRGSSKGAELIAARWADHRKTPQVAFKPDWTKHAKAAPFKRNDQMLEILPIGVMMFPGDGIQNNLADKARKLGIPVWKFDMGGAP